MKVTVAHGVQVVHEGARHTDGATLDVPDDVAGKWLRAGWVSETEPEDKEGNDNEQADTEGSRGSDRGDASRRASGQTRATPRRG